jgi:hypothetical protein
MVPALARNVLSIATETMLARKGLRVVAAPLDSVICTSASSNGVEMIFGDLATVCSSDWAGETAKYPLHKANLAGDYYQFATREHLKTIASLIPTL